MIEDKKHGIVIAENQEESAWFRFKEQQENVIKQIKKEIQECENNIKMSDRRIAKKIRDGAKQSIKDFKLQMKITKELKKLAESKIKKS